MLCFLKAVRDTYTHFSAGTTYGFSLSEGLSMRPMMKFSFSLISEQFSQGDKSGNCPAGFVVDKGLSSAFAKDFFLLSHGGLLGSMSAADDFTFD
jgi:hypothetical protein